MILKWGALLIVWVTFLGSRNLFLEVIASAALIAYSVVRVRRYRQASQPASRATGAGGHGNAGHSVGRPHDAVQPAARVAGCSSRMAATVWVAA